MAVALARAITGRNKVLVFKGGYHGGVFYFRGKGSAVNAPYDFLVAPVQRHRRDPRAGRAARARPRRDPDRADARRQRLHPGDARVPRRSARSWPARPAPILIFDEVMTSRLAPGGLQEKHGILPDMTTLGKYVGGGMSFGAFGGKAELMEWFDPRRKDGFQHAGTFNNNVLTMNAGYVGLTEIYTPERARALNEFGDGLRERLNAVVRRRGLAMQFTGSGSMIGVHMTDAPIRNEADALPGQCRAARSVLFRPGGARHLVRQARHDGAVDRARPKPTPTSSSPPSRISATPARRCSREHTDERHPRQSATQGRLFQRQDRAGARGRAAVPRPRLQIRRRRLRHDPHLPRPPVQAARSISSASTARCAICGSIRASARPRWSRSARRCSTATGIS